MRWSMAIFVRSQPMKRKNERETVGRTGSAGLGKYLTRCLGIARTIYVMHLVSIIEFLVSLYLTRSQNLVMINLEQLPLSWDNP